MEQTAGNWEDTKDGVPIRFPATLAGNHSREIVLANWFSREAAAQESPARKCRESKVGQSTVPSGTASGSHTDSTPAPTVLTAFLLLRNVFRSPLPVQFLEKRLFIERLAGPQ